MNPRMNLLIVGSVATDSIETPSGKVENALGGSAVYASIAASNFARPGIVGVVGGDFESKHIRLLKKKSIDLLGLQTIKAGKTFHWSGYYEGDMNQAHTRATHLNVFESFNPVIPESYRQAPFVLLGNIHPNLQLEVLAQMRSPKVVLCDTMNFWITSAPDLLEKVFRKVDVICINDAEACQFTNTSSVPVAARELLKMGARRVIIKKGAHGVQLFGKNSFFSLPALPLMKVKDPTGAGYTFAGGAIGYLAGCRKSEDSQFRRALAVGTVLASFCVEDFSCRKTGGLRRDQISKRLGALKESIRLPSITL